MRGLPAQLWRGEPVVALNNSTQRLSIFKWKTACLTERALSNRVCADLGGDMLGNLCWVIVLIAAGILMCAGARLVESSWTQGALDPIRIRLVACAACVAILLVLALVYQVKSVARLDGRAVARIVGKHGSTLSEVMSHLTLTGDTVPSLLIATILAIVIERQGIHRVVCWILPLVVLAELVVQLGMWKIFHDTTIAQLHPTLVNGGGGKIPSGSVARLLSMFLIAARLWHSRDPRGSTRIVTLGLALTAMQLVSRLVLARHLLADIAGGIALGLLLALLATLLVGYTTTFALRRSNGSRSGALSYGRLAPRSES